MPRQTVASVRNLCHAIANMHRCLKYCSLGSCTLDMGQFLGFNTKVCGQPHQPGWGCCSNGNSIDIGLHIGKNLLTVDTQSRVLLSPPDFVVNSTKELCHHCRDTPY
jgi:hypothetical protein